MPYRNKFKFINKEYHNTSPVFFKFESIFQLFEVLMNDSTFEKLKNVKRIDKYILRGEIGKGAFSIVKLAQHEENKRYFACKIVPKSRLSTNHLKRRFEDEIRINRQMHHPGIVGLTDLKKDENNYYVFMEFCSKGELFSHIVENNRLDEEDSAIKIYQILDTLDYIHKMNVVHRDLKPENVLIDANGNLKISDFGLSKFLGQDGLTKTPCGSPCYASPECISGKPYDGKASDIWSTGVILYAMLTGQLPWTKRNQQQLFEQIKRGEYTIPNFVSSTASDFIRGLMTVDCKERLTIKKAMEHPFLKKVKPSEYTMMTPYQMISLKTVDNFFNKDQDIDVPKLSNVTKSRSASDFDKYDTVYNILSGIKHSKKSRRIAKNGEIEIKIMKRKNQV